MSKTLIYRLGSHPKRSLKFFLFGLVIVLLAGALIALGYYQDHRFQIAGLVLLFPGLCCAFYGYIGIFSNRFSQVIEAREKRRQALKDNDPFA
ncbi:MULTISPECIES: hypothetical protein [unclassified Pseudoalteromonas]|uniref:hypothetical protein n=1 Tax=unclassified Pseudoalteromonas TaxID=194690 RepID=UPI001F47D812|nr:MULTISPECIES: hypothetical protein [unclassified Pseudoalteromonas]MCF2829451.1 hypothetical protein [Pseudoalteromonas sp. OF5H-5]MCF2830907.1 hypothetical protein [Pseudoalteromonas sp. DL2-H6]MCF2927138.1 hypothetical protein [Pseudoalteromonas sp. DL2-H1]MCG7554960.1 hypothetical protein [Pseudoalteromonas sp. Of11M-6]